MNIRINPEYAKIAPQLSKVEENALQESIKTNGLYNPIVVNEQGIILDGYNRFRICTEFEIKLDTITKKFEDNLQEKMFVIETNLRRRQLNDFQKAELMIPLLEIEKELAKKRQLSGLKGNDPLEPSGTNGKSTEKVAKIYGLSTRTFERAKKVIEKAPIETKNKVRIGKYSISYAYNLVNRAEKKKNPKPIPDGQFEVILADPPYKYDFNGQGSPENHYDVMDTEDICKMKIPSADDSVLFIFVPQPKLKDGIKILESWGYEYKTGSVWVKDRTGTGYYFRAKHELLLLGIKGNIPVPEEKDRPDSVFYAPRTTHSKKPEIVYEKIEKMYPNRKYFEMFARNNRENWTSWGNEIE